MILVAPTAFKGTLSARAAADAMARGAAQCAAHATVLPLSDGGPGLIDALRTDSDRLDVVTIPGPLRDPVDARVLWRATVAFIESADACGLHLVPRELRDPLKTTTRGLGELLKRIQSATEHCVIGLGGSATVDGGIGLAAALGWKFLDNNGQALDANAASLERIARIERPPSPFTLQVTALADVTTPLFGPHGAARVFGPQKGADPATVESLDAGLANLAGIIARDIGVDVARMTGGGAAGGLGAAVVSFLGGRLERGSEWVLRETRFDELLAEAQLVITGEGSFDEQSALGKITGEVIARAGRRGVPVLLIAGAVRVPVPSHVTALTGKEELTEGDLEALAREGCGRLLGTG